MTYALGYVATLDDAGGRFQHPSSFYSYRPVGPSSAKASSRATGPRLLRWDGLHPSPAARCIPDGSPDSLIPTPWRIGLVEFQPIFSSFPASSAPSQFGGRE